MLVTAKVSEISVQVAGVVDWKNKAEDRFDSIQRSIDTLNENFIAEASWCGSGFVYRKLEHTGTERRNSNGYTQTYR